MKQNFDIVFFFFASICAHRVPLSVRVSVKGVIFWGNIAGSDSDFFYWDFFWGIFFTVATPLVRD